ncbi:hypothetical protein R0J90_13785, partial [Micrococcus sp. SIMBA_144]
LLASKQKLEKETGWTYAIVRSSLERLEKAELIECITLKGKSGTKIKIIDYSYYQDLRNYKENSHLLRYVDINENIDPSKNRFNNDNYLENPSVPNSEGQVLRSNNKPN